MKGPLLYDKPLKIHLVGEKQTDKSIEGFQTVRWSAMVRTMHPTPATSVNCEGRYQLRVEPQPEVDAPFRANSTGRRSVNFRRCLTSPCRCTS
jgi:hypothetical protein